jgi:anti-sigma regulatory factor (Ser/Thr protein kinase)
MVAVARKLAFDDGETMDILIAVGEALSNAYRHGTLDPTSGLIYLGWRFAGDVLTVTVKDEGPGFVPRGERASVTGGPIAGGHGISLMCRSMDEVEFRSEDGVRVVLRKRLKVRTSPGSATDSES